MLGIVRIATDEHESCSDSPAQADIPDGVQSVELLKKLGFPTVPEDKIFERPGLKFESYPGMQHSSCPEEIRDLAAWLQKVTE